MDPIPGSCPPKFWFSWSRVELRNLPVYQVPPGDFDQGDITMFEKLDMKTSNFPTCYVLIDYAEDGHNAISYEGIFASLGKHFFMMLLNNSYRSFI